ncbi:9909_t:CDS:2 [Ambispora leptoticha]|uniref:9909_t:CDS:1 n=1 Tax=Ambispora leptoticha TaxID=144679 RepID=A0A9N8ZE96_9GLOM|nr:9909_t:CDS:2 [Ambispora leptoticha]
MSNLEEWASEKLTSFLGLDRETLEGQIIPYLLSFDNESGLAKHLEELLGVNDGSTTFIEEFIAKRFPPQKQITTTQQTRVLKTHQFPTPAKQNRQKDSRSSSPQPNKNDSQEAWQRDKNAYMKSKDDDEDYFAGSKKSKTKNLTQINKENPTTTDSSASKPPLPPPNLDQQDLSISSNFLQSSRPTTPNSISSTSRPSTPTITSSKKKASNKSAKKKLTDLEKTMKDLEKDQSSDSKRVPCSCQATKHPLLEVAPNCLNCGKIICTFEGVGPCTFCGSPVISREQQLEIAREVRKLKNTTSQQQKSMKKKKAGGGSVPYAAKVSGNFAAVTASGGWVELGHNEEDEKIQDQIREERRRAAEMHKEKLLDYDRTSAKRSIIIDQAADFTLPADRPNLWLNEKEQAELQKKQESNLRKIQKKSYEKRRVYSLKEVNGRHVLVEEVPPNLEFIPEFINSKSKTAKSKDSAAQKNNEKIEVSNKKKTPRVQDIDEYFKDTAMFSGGTEVNLVDNVEPECG